MALLHLKLSESSLPRECNLDPTQRNQKSFSFRYGAYRVLTLANLLVPIAIIAIVLLYLGESTSRAVSRAEIALLALMATGVWMLLASYFGLTTPRCPGCDRTVRQGVPVDASFCTRCGQAAMQHEVTEVPQSKVVRSSCASCGLHVSHEFKTFDAVYRWPNFCGHCGFLLRLKPAVSNIRASAQSSSATTVTVKDSRISWRQFSLASACGLMNWVTLVTLAGFLCIRLAGPALYLGVIDRPILFVVIEWCLFIGVLRLAKGWRIGERDRDARVLLWMVSVTIAAIAAFFVFPAVGFPWAKEAVMFESLITYSSTSRKHAMGTVNIASHPSSSLDVSERQANQLAVGTKVRVTGVRNAWSGTYVTKIDPH